MYTKAKKYHMFQNSITVIWKNMLKSSRVDKQSKEEIKHFYKQKHRQRRRNYLFSTTKQPISLWHLIFFLFCFPVPFSLFLTFLLLLLLFCFFYILFLFLVFLDFLFFGFPYDFCIPLWLLLSPMVLASTTTQ